ncbi:MAG: COQ9 family protein [Pseudomonadota bacterium]
MSKDAQNASGDADPVLEARARILTAALPNVPFDGWSDACLKLAIEDAGVDRNLAKLAYPRGGLDLASAFHRLGDEEMVQRLKNADLGAMRIRERVTFAVRTRIEIAARHREAVRKGAALYALPTNTAEGARLIWETADHIWTALGDPSEDLNWYSKRAILSGVYSSTVLYWLGDNSEGFEDTWGFLDRRIDGVMRFEKFKAQVKENPLGRMLMRGPEWLASRVRKPGGPVETGTPVDLPG